jgi:hypothetical protein
MSPEKKKVTVTDASSDLVICVYIWFIHKKEINEDFEQHLSPEKEA